VSRVDGNITKAGDAPVRARQYPSLNEEKSVLLEQTKDQLRTLKLTGLLEALEQQLLPVSRT